MFVLGVGTAVPATRYTQPQCWEAIQKAPQYGMLDRRARVTLQRVLLGDNGIRTRHLALEPLAEAFDARPDVLHARFARHAPRLAADAALSALRRANVGSEEVD